MGVGRGLASPRAAALPRRAANRRLSSPGDPAAAAPQGRPGPCRRPVEPVRPRRAREGARGALRPPRPPPAHADRPHRAPRLPRGRRCPPGRGVARGGRRPGGARHLLRARRAGAWDVPEPGAGLVAARTIRPGRASGPLLGGTLTLLAHLAGTPYAPSLEGAILFLEDVGEKPYRIGRCLTQLRLAGALDGLAGIAVGLLTQCDDGGVLAADVVREAALALGVPAVEGLPAGHDDANFALPLGARATLVAPAPGEEGPPRLLFDGWTGRSGA